MTRRENEELGRVHDLDGVFIGPRGRKSAVTGKLRYFGNYRMIRKYDSTGLRQMCARNVVIPDNGEESVRNGAAC